MSKELMKSMRIMDHLTGNINKEKLWGKKTENNFKVENITEIKIY